MEELDDWSTDWLDLKRQVGKALSEKPALSEIYAKQAVEARKFIDEAPNALKATAAPLLPQVDEPEGPAPEM